MLAAIEQKLCQYNRMPWVLPTSLSWWENNKLTFGTLMWNSSHTKAPFIQQRFTSFHWKTQKCCEEKNLRLHGNRRRGALNACRIYRFIKICVLGRLKHCFCVNKRHEWVQHGAFGPCERALSLMDLLSWRHIWAFIIFCTFRYHKTKKCLSWLSDLFSKVHLC